MDHHSSGSELPRQLGLPLTMFFLLSASWSSIARFSSFEVGVEGGLREEIG